MAIAESIAAQTLSNQDSVSTNAELTELLTVPEAAHLLKVSVSWVYEHVRPESADRLPVLKFGKYVRFDPRDLRAYIDAKRACRRPSGRRH